MKAVTTLIVATLMFLFLAGCEKQRLDQQVKELCAKDGGVKVYETVHLPPNQFDQWGMVKFYSNKGEMSVLRTEDKRTIYDYALGTEYVFKSETEYFRRGDPEMWRSHYQIVRRSDGRVLGEAISYSRRGGDIPGPWHPSSIGCPDRVGDVSLINSIFIQSH